MLGDPYRTNSRPTPVASSLACGRLTPQGQLPRRLAGSGAVRLHAYGPVRVTAAVEDDAQRGRTAARRASSPRPVRERVPGELDARASTIRNHASPRVRTRQQLKWLLTGSVLAGAGLAATAGESSSHSASVRILAVIGLVATLGIPLSVGVAILKYRLYDIDRVISRTLAYAIVTGLLIGVYAGLVLLATRVLSVHTPVAVAAATLAAAALFNPLRRRVQRAVDRRFNRARYDSDQTVMAFAARLKDAVDLDSVRDDLAQVVSRALEPAHLSVWISHRD